MFFDIEISIIAMKGGDEKKMGTLFQHFEIKDKKHWKSIVFYSFNIYFGQ